MSSRTNTAALINGRWVVKVQKNGVRKAFYSSKPGKKGQQEANAKADAWLDGEIVDAKCRVRDIWKDYLADVEAHGGCSNYRRIKSIGECYILPVLGNKKLSNLTEGDLQTLVNHAYKHGTYGKSTKRPLKPGETLSRKTLSNLVATMKNFIKYCRVVARATTMNPETLKVPTSSRKGQKSILQPDELKVLFQSETTTWRGKPVSDPFICAYRLSVLTSLRPGELIGLRWGDVALNDTQLNIRRAINVHNEETSGKNENAIRSVPLSNYAKSVVKDQRERTLEDGRMVKASEPVFDISCEQTYYKYWQRYCKANDIGPVTLYELRHTFVSIASLLPAGEVKPYIGHSHSMDTFGTYGHHVNAYDQQVCDDFTEVFGKLLG